VAEPGGIPPNSGTSLLALPSEPDAGRGGERSRALGSGNRDWFWIGIGVSLAALVIFCVIAVVVLF
jgi:hypothetical protein